jgi:hypothetical protein
MIVVVRFFRGDGAGLHLCSGGEVLYLRKLEIGKNRVGTMP